MKDPNEKRELLAQLFAGNITPEEFKQQARQRPGGLMGRAMSRFYQDEESPGPDDLIRYTDPETRQARWILHRDFQALAEVYEQPPTLIVYSGDFHYPVTSEEDIRDPDEPETEAEVKARLARREAEFSRHWAEYRQQGKAA